MNADSLVLSLLVIGLSFLLYLSNRKVADNRLHFILLGIILVESIRIIFFFPKIHFIFPIITIAILSYFYKVKKEAVEQFEITPLTSSLHFLSSYYYLISLLILSLLFILEWTLFDGELTTNGYLLILFSIILLFSGNIPINYQKEYDFIFFFILFLILFTVFPDVSYKFYTSSYGIYSSGWFDNTEIVHLFLALPLSNLLKLLGFTIAIEGDIIFYEDLESNKFTGLKIAQSCSGIESIVVFISAFFSYSIVDYKRYGRYIFILALFGVIIAYISNLLRMSIIVIVGHYYGHEALLWVHTNIGWILFIIWISFFWFLLERFFPVKT